MRARATAASRVRPGAALRIGRNIHFGAVTTMPMATAADATSIPRDVVPLSVGDPSPIGMFLAADATVQAVLVVLLGASLLTWTICFAKSVELRAERRRLRGAVRAVIGAADIESVGDVGCPVVADMVVEAEDEMARSTPVIAAGAKERIALRLDRIAARAVRRQGAGMGLLAIIGSTAPFVGLFGTVWGIMHSFVGIAESRTTNLAVVAPGIAEALLTTAFGLVAAIPAVVVYNLFSRMLSGYRADLGDASVAVQCLAGRDLDLAAARG